MSLSDNYQLPLVFASTFLVSYVIYRTLRATGHSKAQLPPTLPSLPLVGSVPFMPDFTEWHIYFLQKSKEIGNVFACYLGTEYTLILNGKKTIREALVKRSTDFADRIAAESFPYSIHSFNPNNKGILDHRYNSEFRRQHQLVLSILKEFGFGKDIMETRILTEVSALISRVRDLKGHPFNPDSILTSRVVNVIYSILFGHHLSDASVSELVMLVHDFAHDVVNLIPMDFFHPLRYLPNFRRYYKTAHDQQNRLFGIIDNGVESVAHDSFIQYYMDREGSELDVEQLRYILRDMLLAGTETSASTLLWSLALLACPNGSRIQSRMRAEIDAQVPRTQLPSLTDRQRLPYVEATILEVMRIKTVVVFAQPHMTMCDTTVDGYFIPANTTVFANLYSVHMDPTTWQDPGEFRPERFLDESGHVVGRDRIMPFSLGRRSCLGELLAQQEIYLFLTGLIQNFVIEPPEGREAVGMHEKVGITVAPEPYEVRLIYRT